MARAVADAGTLALGSPVAGSVPTRVTVRSLQTPPLGTLVEPF